MVQNDWYDAENRDSADAEKACQTDCSPKSRPKRRVVVQSVVQAWARLWVRRRGEEDRVGGDRFRH